MILSMMGTIEMSEAGNCFMAFKDDFGFGGWAGEEGAGRGACQETGRGCRSPSEHGNGRVGLSGVGMAVEIGSALKPLACLNPLCSLLLAQSETQTLHPRKTLFLTISCKLYHSATCIWKR